MDAVVREIGWMVFFFVFLLKTVYLQLEKHLSS